MRFSILSLFVVASLATSTFASNMDPNCHLNTKEDLTGDNLLINSLHGDGVVDITAQLPAHAGSLFLAPSYAAVVYPASNFEGYAEVIENNNRHAFVNVPGGAYVNVSSLKPSYGLLSALADGFGIKSMRCYKIGTLDPNTAERAFPEVKYFYNDKTFTIPPMTAHGTYHVANLTNLDGKPLLKIVEYPAHESTVTYTLDLASGAVTIAKTALYEVPASSVTFNKKDGYAYLGALAIVSNRLKTFGTWYYPGFLGWAAYPELFEVSAQLERALELHGSV